MSSCWLLFFSCFVALLPLGSRANHQGQSAVDQPSFDHDIYPHHSIIHTLFHRFQGHPTANDLPQNWPVTPRKAAPPVYQPAQPIAAVGYVYHYHPSYWPAFQIRRTDGNGRTRQTALGAETNGGLRPMTKQETTVCHPVDPPPSRHYVHRKRLSMPHLITW